MKYNKLNDICEKINYVKKLWRKNFIDDDINNTSRRSNLKFEILNLKFEFDV